MTGNDTTVEKNKIDKKSSTLLLHRFIDRNRMNLAILLSFVLQLIIVIFWYTPDIKFDRLERLIDEVAFVDNVNIIEPTPVESESDDGELELTDKKQKPIEKKEDPRISGAQDATFAGATSPIDLKPGEKPLYTEDARSAGITGTVTLEVIIAETGEVLRVRSVGKKLGFGLEESAIKTYKKKKFSPSILNGKAITVKVLVPIRFTLN
jgi:TonB family protein